MLRPRLKTILIAFTILVTLVIICGLGVGAYSYFVLEKEMTQKLETKNFIVPTEYYASPQSFMPRNVVMLADLEHLLQSQNYRKRDFDQRLLGGDYFIGTPEQCSSRLQIPFNDLLAGCLGWVTTDVRASEVDTSIQVLMINKDNTIARTLMGAPFKDVPEVSTEASFITCTIYWQRSFDAKNH
jgi:penicillin-binding protein 1B